MTNKEKSGTREMQRSEHQLLNSTAFMCIPTPESKSPSGFLQPCLHTNAAASHWLA